MDDLANIIIGVVRDRFPEAIIDKVTVRRDVDSDGDPILRVNIVFDEKSPALDSEKMVGLVRHLRPRLAENDVSSFPLVRFLSKKDAASIDREAA